MFVLPTCMASANSLLQYLWILSLLTKGYRMTLSYDSSLSDAFHATPVFCQMLPLSLPCLHAYVMQFLLSPSSLLLLVLLPILLAPMYTLCSSLKHFRTRSTCSQLEILRLPVLLIPASLCSLFVIPVLCMALTSRPPFSLGT